MEIIILNPDIISVSAIFIIITSMIIIRLKKLLMTYALLITNFIIFVITLLFPIVIQELGFRPIYLSGTLFPQIYTLFTSMFIHADFLHIVGNMLIFYFIGLQFEQRVGSKNFILIYLLSGICGSLTHAILNLNSSIPLVGASGAIFGIMGAFAFAYPQDEVIMPIPLGFFMIIRRVKVIFAVLLFAGLETIIVLIGSQDNTAHFAHLGGLIGGVVLAALIIKRKFQYSKNSVNPEIISPTHFQQKPTYINFSKLETLATTPELKEMLLRIKQETVPQVRDIWLEHFLEKTKCPLCNSILNHFNGKIWCEHCTYKSNY
jgi:membrane associated rhomboid family serine protease